jgi:hypothetical protein
MNLKPILRLALSGFLLTAGCMSPPRYGGHPPSGSYAELRVRDSDNEIQLVICNDVPHRHILTIGGGMVTGGHLTFFGAILQGDGPVYRNPEPMFNPVGDRSSQGTITVDREHNRVIIDLQIEKDGKFQPGVPLVKTIIPCPANGTYPIRLYIHAPWVAQYSDPG